MKLQLNIKQVIEYLPKRELSKRFPLIDFKSVSQVLKDPKSDAWFKSQLRDKNSAMAKACRQGTKTHKALEIGQAKDTFTAACLFAFKKEILIDIDEVWGQEEWLAHPLGYKGRFDGVGIFRGKLTLFDHKKTNKRKTFSGLKNYFKQLVAYQQAHEYLYTEHKIEQVAIFNIYGTTIDSIGTNVTILTPDQMTTFRNQFNERVKVAQGLFTVSS